MAAAVADHGHDRRGEATPRVSAPAGPRSRGAQSAAASHQRGGSVRRRRWTRWGPAIHKRGGGQLRVPSSSLCAPFHPFPRPGSSLDPLHFAGFHYSRGGIDSDITCDYRAHTVATASCVPNSILSVSVSERLWGFWPPCTFTTRTCMSRSDFWFSVRGSLPAANFWVMSF